MAINFQTQDNWFFECSPMLLYLDDENNMNRFTADVMLINPKVIILDCLQACFGGDENDGEDMATFIQSINILKAQFEASIILVHHTNKNLVSNSSVDKARGHSRLAGYVDTLCYMAEQPNGVQLQIKARQASREVPNINIRFDNYLWNVV